VTRIASFSEWISRQPLVWGGLACLAFYAAIRQGLIDSPLVVRYADSHVVEYVTIALFFIGLAALTLRLVSLVVQYGVFHRELLEPIPSGGQAPAEAGRLLDKLALLPDYVKQSYLVERLRRALEYVFRKDSADDLDRHMQQLEEADAIRMSNGYAMVRIVVWAIPILGFLGTVIGITMAIAKLSPEALETSLTDVTSRLGLAFDTTALALSLSMVLMFFKFWVERVEDNLLEKVDKWTAEELVGRFYQSGTGSDPNVAAVRLMSKQVVEAVEAMAAKQAKVWKSSIEETHQQWAEVTGETGKVVEQSLAGAMTKAGEAHARALNQGALKHLDVAADAARENAERFGQAMAKFEASAEQHVQQLTAATGEHAKRFADETGKTAERLRLGLEKFAELLIEVLEQHGELLTRSEKEMAQENRQHLSEVQAVLGEVMTFAADRHEVFIKSNEVLLQQTQNAVAETTDISLQQQQHLLKQGEVLLKIVDATGQVHKLEEVLSRNLATVGRSGNFEETLVSLTAAVQLLSARLGHFNPGATSHDVRLGDSKSDAA